MVASVNVPNLPSARSGRFNDQLTGIA